MCFEGSLPLLTYGVLCTDLIHFRENASAKGTMFIYKIYVDQSNLLRVLLVFN